MGVVIPEGPHRQRVDSGVELCGWAGGDVTFGACGVCFRIVCGEIYGAEVGARARRGGGDEVDLEGGGMNDAVGGSGRSATLIFNWDWTGRGLGRVYV